MGIPKKIVSVCASLILSTSAIFAGALVANASEIAGNNPAYEESVTITKDTPNTVVDNSNYGQAFFTTTYPSGGIWQYGGGIHPYSNYLHNSRYHRASLLLHTGQRIYGAYAAPGVWSRASAWVMSGTTQAFYEVF
ncbi:hypothetical protein CPA40_10560 [Bifidobacterium callitrichos]|uniref:Lactococcin 972 family bacteriocin n=1 Tax=Bifidobacterium callitrichos TaxID=762209 RepID=A0A2T3G805_9BIFI|nr:lactococcin 972 family bacteriocin [Bifidobacterium callitrichos]PST45541.1 hypothetical protein CPA40_10560 [Bifidobacterium callitrichos]